MSYQDITVAFKPTDSLQDRFNSTVEFFAMLPFDLVAASVINESQQEIPFRKRRDLLSAHAVRVTYELVQDPVCQQCGCTNGKDCFHATHGPCWWIQKDLCSHCLMEMRGEISNVMRPWKQSESGVYDFSSSTLKR